MNYHKKVLTAYFLEQGFALDLETIEGKSLDDHAERQGIQLFEAYRKNHYKALFNFGFVERSPKWSSSVLFLHDLSARFILRLSHQGESKWLRKGVILNPTADDIRFLLDNVPFVVGLKYIDAQWIEEVFRNLSLSFQTEFKAYNGGVSEFLTAKNPKILTIGRIFFHLVENKSEDFPFAFLATYSSDSENEKKSTHMPLKNALLEYKDQQEALLKLLSTVSLTAQKSNFISNLVETGELFSPLKLTSREAYTFLTEIPLYESCGILCRIPDWWKKKSHSFKLAIKVGDKEPSRVGMDALLAFDPALYFGDDAITEEEMRALMAQTAGLSLIKGKWVEVDPEKLQKTLDAYLKAKNLKVYGEYTIAEAMRLQLNADQIFGELDEDISVEITHGKWLKEVTEKLLNPIALENVTLGQNFSATLRAYQQKGLDWLNYMRDLGFGACLADDMGLGKTVQVIALLEHLRGSGQGKNLLVIPASLMGNWQKEIDKFAPKLRYCLIYSAKDKFVLQEEDGIDLYITTYGLAVRLEALKTMEWDLVILDEAQAIKNPGTKQTKAVKLLKARSRIALTGTPIENGLSDLWSLFDFLNGGLLGSAKEFTTFTKRLKEGHEDYSKLRSVINPFILRRLKTDKTVIDDLPEKIEMKAYTTLSKKQVVLYNALVKELAQKLETTEGIQRKGLVLASIMKFKQICNHPDQYLGQEAFHHEHSGKFERLYDICETIYQKREKVIVFTQFKTMTQPLADFLETIFNHKGLILHGETPVKSRSALVDQFCGEEYVPFMVLSLKAGGVGLNLTAANHVIHFDRWWNPAVENQATDRAFRIGQQKNVMVHKLITTGTIEEKIDLMIEEKSKLAGDMIAASGENWITELDNKALMELFKLVKGGEN